MKDKLAEQQRAMKQAKKTEETLRGELKKILEENERKEQTIRRYSGSKQLSFVIFI